MNCIKQQLLWHTWHMDGHPDSVDALAVPLAPGLPAPSLFEDLADLSGLPGRRVRAGAPRRRLDGMRPPGVVSWGEVGAGVSVVSEPCASLLRANDAVDVPVDLAINPYRGCAHACRFCDSASTAVVHAKANAADRLREALRQPRYQPRVLNLGSLADAYQPIESSQGLTRSLLEVLLQAHHPVALATRSAGVVRDLDLLAPMAARHQTAVLMSLCSRDEGLAALLEPGASRPARRLAAVRQLARAGVWVGINLSPLAPGLNDHEIEPLVRQAARAGARSVHWSVLRAPQRGWDALLGALAGGSAMLSRRTGRPPAPAADGSPAASPLLPMPDLASLATWEASIAQQVAEAAARHGLTLEFPALDCSGFVPPDPPRRAAGPWVPRAGQGELF